MSPKKSVESIQRNVALCYIRLSLTRDESDLNSPARQRANIQAECDRRGWITEWYEDVDGHKSGTQEENRPGWLALKERLSDPDVVAVVANDLSRLHRKGWRVGSLLDFLEQHQVGLVLAAPGRNLDLSGPTGKISTMIMALMDEYYATDTSHKQIDSVRYRRSRGIVVGPIPFGTARNKEGHLTLSPKGVWLLPDGTFIEGTVTDTVPVENAIWRGFADAARRCLELFSVGHKGRRKIADVLNKEGFRYRSSEGQIDLFESDDIRRIAANWVEYGGGMVAGKAKDRHAKDVNPDTVALDSDRAVFDVELCRLVGYVKQKRSRNPKRTPDYAVKLDSTVYPLSKLIYCAHCEREARNSGNNSVRSYLTGKTGNKVPSRRYRHDTERRCPAHTRSVKADLIERDFLYLLENLTVNPDSLPMLAEALEHFNKQANSQEQSISIDGEIAYWRQRAKNADTMFSKARISEEDWQEAIANAEHEIARLQAKVAERTEAELALQITLEMVSNLVQNWNHADDDQRRAFANGLFEYLVYDLDERRIVDFQLKPWVNLLMRLKLTFENDKNTPSQSDEIERVLVCPQRGSTPYLIQMFQKPVNLFFVTITASICLWLITENSPTPQREINRFV